MLAVSPHPSYLVLISPLHGKIQPPGNSILGRSQKKSTNFKTVAIRKNKSSHPQSRILSQFSPFLKYFLWGSLPECFIFLTGKVKLGVLPAQNIFDLLIFSHTFTYNNASKLPSLTTLTNLKHSGRMKFRLPFLHSSKYGTFGPY